YFVTTTSDDEALGPCQGTQCPTLRAANAAAGDTPPSTIHVPAGRTQLTAAIDPADGTKIVGAGANQTTIAAPAGDRVFNIDNAPTTTLESLTMSGGVEPDSSGGGTLRIGSGAVVVLDHVRVTGGQASVGGGIFDDAAQSLTITHSLIDGNRATGPGGGI